MRMNLNRRIWTALALMALLGPAATSWAEDNPNPPLDKGGTDQAGGTVKGVIKFDGAKKKTKPIRMNADPVCATKNEGHVIRPETYVFGKNDTLTNVLVWVSKGLEGKTFEPKGKRVIDQRGCMYVPHVQAVMVGQELEIRSSDPTLHNIKMGSKKNGNFNISIPGGGAPKKQIFKNEEIGTLNFKCDVHPWMAAKIHVLKHPFYAITQKNGTFEIKGLPPGDYEVSVKHEFDKFKPKEKTMKVSVKEGETEDLTFTYKPPARKKKK